MGGLFGEFFFPRAEILEKNGNLITSFDPTVAEDRDTKTQQPYSPFRSRLGIWYLVSSFFSRTATSPERASDEFRGKRCLGRTLFLAALKCRTKLVSAIKKQRLQSIPNPVYLLPFSFLSFSHHQVLAGASKFRWGGRNLLHRY